MSGSGLPDGILFKPKIPIWENFVGSCNGRCWHILWPFGICILWTFGIFYGHLVYFSHFGMLYQEKSGNPGQVYRKKEDIIG
jgi:hypothetical protein